MTDNFFSLPVGCILRRAGYKDIFLLTNATCLLYFYGFLFNIRIIVTIISSLPLLISIVKYFDLNFIGIIILSLLDICITISPAFRPLWSWSKFSLIKCNGRLVGIAELRRYRKHSELDLLIVRKTWRGKGVGSALVKHLIQEVTKPIYLVCRPKLVGFYTRLGFVSVPWEELPKYLSFRFAIWNIQSELGDNLVVMRYPEITPQPNQSTATE